MLINGKCGIRAFTPTTVCGTPQSRGLVDPAEPTPEAETGGLGDRLPPQLQPARTNPGTTGAAASATQDRISAWRSRRCHAPRPADQWESAGRPVGGGRREAGSRHLLLRRLARLARRIASGIRGQTVRTAAGSRSDRSHRPRLQPGHTPRDRPPLSKPAAQHR